VAAEHTIPLQLDLWQSLQNLKPVALEPKGGTLFRAGDPVAGIYLVEEGQVHLSLPPGPRRLQPKPAFEIAGPRSVLGLCETVTGGEYKLTAEVAEGARISHISRRAFLHFMRRDHQLCLQIVRLLSEDLHCLYYHFRCTAQSGSRLIRPVTPS